jgi:ABC-type sulfate transport system permease component
MFLGVSVLLRLTFVLVPFLFLFVNQEECHRAQDIAEVMSNERAVESEFSNFVLLMFGLANGAVE